MAVGIEDHHTDRVNTDERQRNPFVSSASSGTAATASGVF